MSPELLYYGPFVGCQYADANLGFKYDAWEGWLVGWGGGGSILPSAQHTALGVSSLSPVQTMPHSSVGDVGWGCVNPKKKKKTSTMTLTNGETKISWWKDHCAGKMLLWRNLNVLWKRAVFSHIFWQKLSRVSAIHPPPQQLAWQAWGTQLMSGLPALPGSLLQVWKARRGPDYWYCQAPSW